MRFHLTLALLMFITAFCEGEIVRRAAFDFGSGKIKVQVADVDTETQKILNTLFTESKVVLLSEAIAHQKDGLLTQEIQDEAVSAAFTLKQKAVEHGATEFRGLATEAYRKANNGQSLIDRYALELDLPVKIISQIEEGKSGFLSLVAEKNLNPEKLISWDIGSGSLQVSYLNDQKNIEVYMAPLGRTTTKNVIIREVKKQDPSELASPNPMSFDEWQQAIVSLDQILPEVPKELLEKLKEEDVKLIGLSAHPEKLRSLGFYQKSDLLKLLRERLDKNDDELAEIHDAPRTAVSELALIYAVMQKLQVEGVNYIRTQSGTTSALLVSEEFWH